MRFPRLRKLCGARASAHRIRAPAAAVARRAVASPRRIRCETTPDTVAAASCKTSCLCSLSLCPSGCKPGGACHLHELRQSPRFSLGDDGPKRRDPVVPPPLVVFLDRRPFARFDEEP